MTKHLGLICALLSLAMACRARDDSSGTKGAQVQFEQEWFFGSDGVLDSLKMANVTNNELKNAYTSMKGALGFNSRMQQLELVIKKIDTVQDELVEVLEQLAAKLASPKVQDGVASASIEREDVEKAQSMVKAIISSRGPFSNLRVHIASIGTMLGQSGMTEQQLAAADVQVLSDLKAAADQVDAIIRTITAWSRQVPASGGTGSLAQQCHQFYQANAVSNVDDIYVSINGDALKHLRNEQSYWTTVDEACGQIVAYVATRNLSSSYAVTGSLEGFNFQFNVTGSGGVTPVTPVPPPTPVICQPTTSSCDSCQESGVKNCRVKDCNGIVVSTHQEGCTVQIQYSCSSCSATTSNCTFSSGGVDVEGGSIHCYQVRKQVGNTGQWQQAEAACNPVCQHWQTSSQSCDRKRSSDFRCR